MIPKDLPSADGVWDHLHLMPGALADVRAGVHLRAVWP